MFIFFNTNVISTNSGAVSDEEISKLSTFRGGGGAGGVGVRWGWGGDGGGGYISIIKLNLNLNLKKCLLDIKQIQAGNNVINDSYIHL